MSMTMLLVYHNAAVATYKHIN